MKVFNNYFAFHYNSSLYKNIRIVGVSNSIDLGHFK